MDNLVEHKSTANGDVMYTARVRKCGNALFLSKYGQAFTFQLSPDERQENFNRIMRSLEASTSSNPQIATELRTRIGSFDMDASMCVELGAVLMVNMVEEDLGDLLDQYPPMN